VSLGLHVTVWASLAMFVAGEVGKRRARVPDWFSSVWLAGAVLCCVHIVLAFAGPHAWSHQAAVRETARQTAAIYGLDWGGGVYVNYVFVAAWLIEACWWRFNPASYRRRPWILTWGLRTFYFVIIVNAAIVFARPPFRPFGLLLSVLLMWAWRPAHPRPF
jgi:hypothetical protein